ncbi:MAG: hypothetical protein L0207_07015 [Chlamydiae bacterium]|nr:hypothetical protein [Chlamydiota bacterium]
MQLYALDGDRSVFASDAEKRVNYLCQECFEPLRVKKGHFRHPHFFHLHNHLNKCSLRKKSLIHIQTQLQILSLFPQNTILLEKKFFKIGRIADAVMEKEKRVFEIQCSPISTNEVQNRIQDYESLGYEIFWILHDRTFNRKNLSPAELFLRERGCYFTNINEKGEGIIYDQMERIHFWKRSYTSFPYKVNLRVNHPIFPIKDTSSWIEKRLKLNKSYHEGDLVDRFQKGYLQEKEQKEKKKFSLKEFYRNLLLFIIRK